MKKLLWTTLLVVTFFAFYAVSASAVVNDTVKVGLKYGSGALFSANLENAVGSGYEFGYFDADRDFVALGETEETTLSMTAAGTIYMNSSGVYSDAVPAGSYRVLGAYHAQLDGFGSFEEAQEEAQNHDDAYPAYISGEYVVRVGCYADRDEAEDMAADIGGEAVKSGSTGVLVTCTKSTEVLFEFDCQGAVNLGVLPQSRRESAVTWFKGYKYYGGFEYVRVTGGSLNVINVVELEDYVKGVVPYEMPGDWPLAALEAQAVCARNFVCRTTKHLSLYGFDVCNTTDCQVYYGVGNGSVYPSERSDEAVENTAGVCMYYDGELVEAVYHSSDGGATEDAANVWGSEVPYLKGKADPYEAMTTIPNYGYTVTYTMAELTWVLQNSGYSIGTVEDVIISEQTAQGNVYKVTFVDTSGRTLTVKGDDARMAFYSTTYGKNVRSLRFEIVGGSSGSGGSCYVNGTGNRLSSLDGVSVISGSGTVSQLTGDSASVVTASGTGTVTAGGGNNGTSGVRNGSLTIIGTGNGHNVGLSQYGAKAMAEQGYDYQDILEFYYTDVTVG
ncbi:stage II sporulation protein D [Oscillibacter sp. PC13]|uniref:SpoIID/LytB domain-containing protein n=1 Tax=Oscillibacter sp. PC13 TaxID=1855299 RepID=UPI0008E1B3C8|nr:SpoIID/LytB domain-containing protein [Oscillibacter sp. PC13]SFP56864.1 stage II sporulation protein D [Oscillibacter sp. PC13]